MKNAVRKRPVTELFNLPAEIVPGVPRLTMSGGSQVLVENHGGLKSYTRECIEIRGRNMLLQIRGEDLELTAMTKTDIVIRGIVVAVELC
ncbi:MAG: sporulation protein [Oscillospiraceae bacterium]|nr:sporulation protein [Oscillospiraceae bacterium]